MAEDDEVLLMKRLFQETRDRWLELMRAAAPQETLAAARAKADQFEEGLTRAKTTTGR